ncbi:MAG TPA: glycosyltransferase 87 family protein [Micromonosporaceae bacterium]
MPATVERRTGAPAAAPERRAGRSIDRPTAVRLAVVVGAFAAAWIVIETLGRPYTFFDMKIYHGAVVWWSKGYGLYDFVAPRVNLGFTYPPFAALVMLPMAILPLGLAGWLNVVFSVAALAVVLAALLRPLADRHGWPLWFTVGIAVPLAAALEPARETLGYGQVNLLLFALVIADLVALRWRARGGARPMADAAPLRRFWLSGAWAGVGIGLATSIKLTPALFIFYLMVTRQWRAAGTAIATAIGATLVALSVAGHETATYFTTVLWQTDRVGDTDMTPNQSLAGVLARLYDSMETPGLLYVSFALVLLAVGITRAASAHDEGDELTAFTLVGLTANGISPISWTHHLVFVIPAVLVLADAALRRRAASRSFPRRLGVSSGGTSAAVSGLRSPIWFPTLTGLRHGAAALGLYLLFLISPIWMFEHRLPDVSHYQDGLFGALMENSLAISIIVLVAALPWRPGADPVFYAEQPARAGHRPVPAP